MPWEKGQSGNPKGRPKRGVSMAEELQKILRSKDEETGKTNRFLIAQSLVKAAKDGNVMAAREIFDRIDGKVQADQPGDSPENPIYAANIDNRDLDFSGLSARQVDEALHWLDMLTKGVNN